VAEIAKASNREACSVPAQAEAYHKHVKSELSNLERKTVNKVNDGDHSSLEEDADKYKEQLEAVFFKLKESKSYRRTVGSISISCIMAATPLLSSLKQTAYLIDLDIVEVVILFVFQATVITVYILRFIFLINVYVIIFSGWNRSTCGSGKIL
jgi:TELO2-interacting protein 1